MEVVEETVCSGGRRSKKHLQRRELQREREERNCETEKRNCRLSHSDSSLSLPVEIMLLAAADCSQSRDKQTSCCSHELIPHQPPALTQLSPTAFWETAEKMDQRPDHRFYTRFKLHFYWRSKTSNTSTASVTSYRSQRN